MLTPKQVEAALAATLDAAKQGVKESWTSEPDREKREQLWSEYKAIERIEETLRNDFASIIERAADQPGQ